MYNGERRKSTKELSTTEARTQLACLIAEARATYHPRKITSKQGNAVLIAEDDWRATVETVHLMSVPGLGENLKEGLKTPSINARKRRAGNVVYQVLEKEEVEKVLAMWTHYE